MEEKFTIRFKMSYKEIMKRYESLKSEEEKKQLLEYLENRQISDDNLTADGLLITDKMLNQPDNFLDFKKWREEKSAELNKKLLPQKEVYKINWNYEEESLVGLFKHLQKESFIKNISKALLLKHFNLQKGKIKPMRKEVEKLIWLRGPVMFIWLLNYLHQKKIITVNEEKVHVAASDHFCDSRHTEYNKRYLLQNFNNTLDFTKVKKDKNEPYYPELTRIIKVYIPDLSTR